MPDHPTRYWLLAGPTPTGPFTVAEVHAELAAGRAAWDTPACVVGATAWQPLLRTPGVGPHAEVSPAQSPPNTPILSPPPATTPARSPGATPAAPTRPPAKPAASRGKLLNVVGVVLAVGFSGLLVYGLYNAVRPRTATEVCEQFNAATTAAEAKKCCTPRMHPVVDASFAQPDGSDPNDTFEITAETAGTTPPSRRVGFRGTLFLQEAGGRVKIEGYFALLDDWGWKVDDWVISGVEGASLPGPVSLVDEHRKTLAPRQIPQRPGSQSGDFSFKPSTGSGTSAKRPTTGWPDSLNPAKNRWLAFGLLSFGGTAVGALWKWLTRKAEPK